MTLSGCHMVSSSHPLRAAICLGLALLNGCNALSKRDDNAVFGPSPRRTTLEDAANAKAIAEASDLSGGEDDEGQVVQANATEGDDDTDIFNSTVVARANGAPIFAGEVLERWGDYLRQIRPKVSDAEYRKVRDEIIRRDLKSHIQKHLLVERTKGELKPEQLKALQGQLDKMFDKEVERLKKELKVSTRPELEKELNNRGTSLNNIRNSFISQGIARGYIEARADKPKPVTRQDIVDYYQQHQDDYRYEAKVRWRQIQITHAVAGGRAAAETKMKEAQAELDRGVPFEDVVAKYSDGPTANDKGLRDWTNEGSLSDEKLDAFLFSQPVSTAQQFRGGQSCQIVQILERVDAGVKPFSEVQAEIFAKLQPMGPTNVKELIEKIDAEAVIETKYDYQGSDRGA
jgi:hypothetical protein